MSIKEKLRELQDSTRVISLFYWEVCRRAEENMLKTGKLEGSHFAAMKQVMKELGIETE